MKFSYTFRVTLDTFDLYCNHIEAFLNIRALTLYSEYLTHSLELIQPGVTLVNVTVKCEKRDKSVLWETSH